MPLDALLLAATLLAALALRPWRAWPAGTAAPPWPCFALAAGLPLVWSLDRLAQAPLLQPPSLAPLLVLMAGWPLAMLAVPAAALIAWQATGMPLAEALHRAVWLGVVPGTLALLLGLAARRWLPRQPFVYILVRAFLGTWIALVASAALGLYVGGGSDVEPGREDLLLARLLASSGEAVLTGMLVAICVAYRPRWLATWSDRLYLERR